MATPDPIRTADLCDAHPNGLRIMEPVFRDLGGRAAFHGQAVTVACHEDNSRVKEALDESGAGRVLVIDGGGSWKRSLVGGNLAQLAAQNGWAGIIVDGAVRDAHELRAEAVGIKARALIPMKTEKRGRGERDVPVSVAGAVVAPGDWVYADEDGVVVAASALHDMP